MDVSWEIEIYNTIKGNKYAWTIPSVAPVRAPFSDSSIPTFFTSIEWIWIVTNDMNTAQYAVAAVKLMMIRMNIINAGRDLSPRRLQIEVRPLVKSAAQVRTNKVVRTAL